MKKEKFIIFVLLIALLSSPVLAFEISDPSDSQIESLSGDYDVTGMAAWTYQLIADFFGIPMEDMKIRGGYLFAFVIAPILLVYLMFYGIIDKLRLFDNDMVNKMIPLLLALMLAPLGIYRKIFFAITGFMSISAATLLYIFLFVAILGYGYKHMFARGVGDFHAGGVHMADMKGAKNDVKDLQKRIDRMTRRIDALYDRQNNMVKDENPSKYEALNKEIEKLVEERNKLIAYREKRMQDIQKSYHKVIES